MKIRFVALALLLSSSAFAQDVTIYDDALQNGFLDDSYGVPLPDFNSSAQAHDGTKSIALTGNACNAVAMAHPTTNDTGLGAGAYTDAAPAGVQVKAVHWQELRDRTQ